MIGRRESLILDTETMPTTAKGIPAENADGDQQTDTPGKRFRRLNRKASPLRNATRGPARSRKKTRRRSDTLQSAPRIFGWMSERSCRRNTIQPNKTAHSFPLAISRPKRTSVPSKYTHKNKNKKRQLGEKKIIRKLRRPPTRHQPSRAPQYKRWRN